MLLAVLVVVLDVGFSYDNGSSYTILGHLAEGPFHGWGATPSHGGAAAGGIFYTWSTYDNASVRSIIGTYRYC